MNVPQTQLGNGFAVRTASIRVLLEGTEPAVRLCAGGNLFRETLYYIEDARTRWLLAVEPEVTRTGLERLDQPIDRVLEAIAGDVQADPVSRDYVVQTLRGVSVASAESA